MIPTCPHCGKPGFLNRHGILVNTKGHFRGRRYYCCNRGNRRGCGRTHTLFHPDILPGKSFIAPQLWAFLERITQGYPKLHAFKYSGFHCSESSVYRIYRLFKEKQPHIRTLLHRVLKPPDKINGPSPELATIEHLKMSYPGKECPLSEFQQRFQRELLPNYDRVIRFDKRVIQKSNNDNRFSVMDY